MRTRELQKSEERFVEAGTGVRRLTEKLQHLQRSSAEEKEAVLQHAELSCYRVLEEERRSGKIVRGNCATIWRGWRRSSTPRQGSARALT